MEATQHPNQMTIFDLSFQRRLFHSLTVGLLRESEHPARHRNWYPRILKKRYIFRPASRRSTSATHFALRCSLPS